MPNLRNGTKGDSNPGSLDCESGILPLSYRAPHVWTGVQYGDMFTLHIGHVWTVVKYGDMFTLHVGHVWTGVKCRDMFTLHIGHV